MGSIPNPLIFPSLLQHTGRFCRSFEKNLAKKVEISPFYSLLRTGQRRLCGGAGEPGLGELFREHMLPVALGDMVGGAAVGVTTWFSYLRRPTGKSETLKNSFG